MTNVEGRRPEGAPERSPKAGEGAASGVDGKVAKRFSVQRKMAVVARLLRGEPLELVAREMNVSIARLSQWRERALAGAATALKERERPSPWSGRCMFGRGIGRPCPPANRCLPASPRRVRRVMRENGLLAPHRCGLG